MEGFGFLYSVLGVGAWKNNVEICSVKKDRKEKQRIPNIAAAHSRSDYQMPI
jgi:hypothetical protein